MSHQSVPRLTFLVTVQLLCVTILLTGCGLMGGNELADDPQPGAEIEVAVEKVSEPGTVDDDRASPLGDELLPENYATRLRMPDEAAVDLPPIPLRYAMPVSSGANLMKKEETSNHPPAPKLREPFGKSVQSFAPPPVPEPVVATSTDTTVPTGRSEAPAPRRVEKVSADSFHEVVLKSEVPVIVNFTAPSRCPPCRALAPMLDRLAKNQANLRIVKVDTDIEQKLAQRYRIQSVPVVVVFKDGKATARHVGLTNIQKALGL